MIWGMTVMPDAPSSLIAAGLRYSRDSCPAPGRLRMISELLPGAARAHAGRPLGRDVRAGSSGVVPDLDQDPAPLASRGQREAAAELTAVEQHGQVARLVAHDSGRALVPDDHSTAAARRAPARTGARRLAGGRSGLVAAVHSLE